MKNLNKNFSEEQIKNDDINEYLTGGLVDPDFKNGWHTIICTSARVFSIWIHHKQKTVYDFDFIDPNTRREIWLQIIENFEDEKCRSAMKMLYESFFKMSLHDETNGSPAIEDFVTRKCKVLTRKYSNDEKMVKIVKFSPLD